LGLHSGTVSDVCQQYAKSRSQKKRPYMRWRSKKTSLGWVPLKGRNLKETPNGFHFHGREFKVFKSRDPPAGAQIKDGTNFSQDRKANWFLNVCVEVEASVARSPVRGVGIDLGLKDFATLSTGEKIDAQRLYLGAEQALAAELRALAATRWWDRSAEDGPRGVAVKEVAA
jgi:transposase